MEHSPTPKKITTHYGTVELDFVVDRNLPTWARRTHPIVYRHLGHFWRVIPIQLDEAVRVFVVLSALILLTVPIPFLLTIIMPASLISLFALPFGLAYYAQTLYELARDSSQSMVQEIEGNTLPLILATPMPTLEVLLGKIAGAIWRQSDPMTSLFNLVLYTQLPVITLIYASRYPLEEYGAVTQLLVIAMYAVSLIRIPLEMFLISTLGQYIGITTKGNNTASATAIALTVFYFTLLNLPRLLPLPPLLDLVINGVLPLLMPILIGFAILLYSRHEIEHD